MPTCTWRTESNRVVVSWYNQRRTDSEPRHRSHSPWWSQVFPDSLHQRVISIAHESHQGLVKTKNKLLHEKIWLKIDRDVKEMINQCVMCQASGPENCSDPLQMPPLPSEPWHTVHMDFCGPFPTGEYLFVVVDAYSQYVSWSCKNCITYSRLFWRALKLANCSKIVIGEF